MMSTTLQVKDKGIAIIGVGSKTVISAAKTVITEAVSYGK